eukprot:COSAG02_NODE_971_length_15551_cov_4.415157_1_plen_45_part_10
MHLCRTARRCRLCLGDPKRSLRRCPIEDSGDTFHFDAEICHLGLF